MRVESLSLTFLKILPCLLEFFHLRIKQSVAMWNNVTIATADYRFFRLHALYISKTNLFFDDTMHKELRASILIQQS